MICHVNYDKINYSLNLMIHKKHILKIFFKFQQPKLMFKANYELSEPLICFTKCLNCN